MKALQLRNENELELTEVARPIPDDDELLIRTGAATICISDLQDIREHPANLSPPLILGHEGAGTVVEVGANTYGFKPGDRVATHPVHHCGQCWTCKQGLGHLCPNMRHFGLNMPGTFADYFVVRADRARVIPNAVDFAVGTLAEPICVCLEALARARVSAKHSLLIIGDGPFGVLMARLASADGISHVVLAGHHDDRLAFAPTARPVNLKTIERPSDTLLEVGGAHGYNAVIVAVGSATAVSLGLEVLQPKGRLVIFAPISGHTPVDLTRVLTKELEILGSVNDADRFDTAVSALSRPSLALNELVTHRFPIHDFGRAFRVAEDRATTAMKVALIFDDSVAQRSPS